MAESGKREAKSESWEKVVVDGKREQKYELPFPFLPSAPDRLFHVSFEVFISYQSGIEPER